MDNASNRIQNFTYLQQKNYKTFLNIPFSAPVIEVSGPAKLNLVVGPVLWEPRVTGTLSIRRLIASW